MSVELLEQQAALLTKWASEISHLAEHARLATAEMSGAESSLKAARRSLEDAVDAIKADQRNPGFEVQSV